MSRRLVWQAANDLPLSPVTFDTEGVTGLWVNRFAGLGAVAPDPISSKGPGQSGISVLDVGVPPRVVGCAGQLFASDEADYWALRSSIDQAFLVEPVPFGGEQRLGILTLQRDGLADREIEALARSAVVDDVPGAPLSALFDVEWLCPYPYWRSVADSVLGAGIAKRAGPSLVTSGSSSTDATSYATSAVTLKAGRLYLLAVTNTKASAPDTPTAAGGPTWTNEESIGFATAGAPTQRLTVFRAIPSADYTGAVTADFGGQTQTGACWVLVEVLGVDPATTQGVRQSVAATTDSGTTVTATLAAFGSAQNATIGFVAKASAGDVTPGTGFTELADVNAATPAQALEAEARQDNDTGVDASWTGAIGAAIIGLEIVAAGSVAANAGDAWAPITARIWGPASAVTLTNETTGEEFTVTWALAADEYLEVDTSPGTKSIDEVNAGTLVRTNALSGLSLTAARLWRLKPGNNSVALAATGGDARTRLELTWRNRYSGV